MKNLAPWTKKNDERLPYEAPAIIYEGLISTRAGSNLTGAGGDGAADAADLFGDN